MSRWDVSSVRAVRNAHLRKARRAAALARETKGATRATWCEHARQHIKAARREHWMVVAQLRDISRAMFGRKTVFAHQRAPRRLIAA
jgi:hypothetical protein